MTQDLSSSRLQRTGIALAGPAEQTLPAPHFFFTPLSRHADYGFGATGEAFKEAADQLIQVGEGLRRPNAHLPTNFLYRHAIELYLKSIIIIIHRRLRLQFGTDPPDGEPHVLHAEKWIHLHKVHSIAILYSYFKSLVTNHRSKLDQICRTDWASIPPDVDRWVQTIEDADRSSTYFRYPDPGKGESDHAKSSFKASSVTKIFSSMTPDDRPSTSFVLLNDEDEIVEAYRFDDHPLPELQSALRQLADLLEGAHFGIRIELADGW